MGRIQDEIEDAYHNERVERDRMAMIQRVKEGEFDQIVATAYRHTNYVALIDARILDGMIDIIKRKIT